MKNKNEVVPSGITSKGMLQMVSRTLLKSPKCHPSSDGNSFFFFANQVTLQALPDWSRPLLTQVQVQNVLWPISLTGNIVEY